jgi:hypothetical protein
MEEVGQPLFCSVALAIIDCCSLQESQYLLRRSCSAVLTREISPDLYTVTSFAHARLKHDLRLRLR